MKKYIFVLICPETGKIRFIGNSSNPIRRYYHYTYDHNKKNAIGDWIRSFKKTKPELKVIEAVTSKEELKTRMKVWNVHYSETTFCLPVKRKKTIMVRFLVETEDFELIKLEADRLFKGKIAEYLRFKVLNKKA